MIEDGDLPIGFTMEMAKHLQTLNQFSGLTKEEQRILIEKARDMKTREQMRNYVENMFR